MEVKSTKKIIVVRMLDWAIVALVVLLFLIVLVGLTTNKPISFWGLQFNLNNNFTATEPSNFIDNPNSVVPANNSNSTSSTNSTAPANTPAAVPAKVAPASNEHSKTISNANTNTVAPRNNSVETSPIQKEKTPPSQSSVSNTIKIQKKDPIINTEVVMPPPSESTVRKSRHASTQPKKTENNYADQGSQESSAESDYYYSNNGNPYNNNGSYRIPKQTPRSISGGGGNGSRNFSPSELNEFMRQFPNKKTDIHFVNFGYQDAEMESVKAQIIDALNKNGYTNIDPNWNKYTDYTTINEVHFGVYGYSGANFYIPKAKN